MLWGQVEGHKWETSGQGEEWALQHGWGAAVCLYMSSALLDGSQARYRRTETSRMPHLKASNPCSIHPCSGGS